MGPDDRVPPLWNPDLSAGEGAKFRALATHIREAARSGRLAPGSRLPPVRDLAWALKVTPGTVARAYQLAAAEGVIESHVGRGSYVAHPRARQAPLQPLLYESVDPAQVAGHLADLRIPQLPDCGQNAVIARHLADVAAGLDADILDYTPLSRDMACRLALLDWLRPRLPGRLSPEDLVLTHGGQNALSLVMAITLVGERPLVMTEALAYPGMQQAARLMRARPLPVALDAEGVIPEALDRVARRSGARLVYLTPSAQNPTAAAMSAARRAAIIAIARRHDLQIVEDECYAPGPDPDHGQALRTLAPERVWYVTSLSKSVAAGLRFGVLVCPDGMGQQGRLAAQHSHMGLSLPITALVTRLLQSGDARMLADKGVLAIEERRLMALRVLAGLDVRSQPGLPFLWLSLPAPWRAEAFCRRAAELGVIVRPAAEFAVTDPEPNAGAGPHLPQAVRIALACRLPPAQLETALTAISRLAGTSPGEMSE